MNAPAPVKYVLFDLDGTLADTAPDLAEALNRMLRDHGRPPLPYERIRPVVSLGGAAMIRLAFDKTEADPEFPLLRKNFLDLYHRDICRHTRLFPGMDQVLAGLESGGVPWGIVTNKPGWLTAPLLEVLALHERAACVISGDTLPQRKPDPAPLLYACSLMGGTPGETVYVGDARRDVEAGVSAGIATVVARYGYIEPGDRIETWGADHVIDSPVELLAWLDSRKA